MLNKTWQDRGEVFKLDRIKKTSSYKIALIILQMISRYVSIKIMGVKSGVCKSK